MSVRFFIVSFWVGLSAFGAQLKSIQVDGEKSAEISFITDASPPAPRMSIEGNRVELTFSGVSLAEGLTQKEFPSPHALLQRIQVEAVPTGVVARLVVNGSSEKLRDRVRLQKTQGSIVVSLTYPPGSEATLKLLQEEQTAVNQAVTHPVPQNRSGFGWIRLAFGVGLFALVAAAIGYFLKFAKKKTGWKGSRRHLIEVLAQSPIGDGRSSVAIVRVASDFVLVGITAQNINMLSALPALAAQYEEENSLERSSFKEAISEEMQKNGRGINA